ncbi:MAG: YkvA family protein [Hydrogenophaga sp.]
MWKRLSVVWMAVKGDALKLWYALGHPESPAWLKAGAAAMVLYLVSPIDLIPDFLPVVGVLDDLILVPLALRWLLARLPAHIRQYAQERSEGGSAAQRSAPPADEVRGGKSRLR